MNDEDEHVLHYRGFDGIERTDDSTGTVGIRAVKDGKVVFVVEDNSREQAISSFKKIADSSLRPDEKH